MSQEVKTDSEVEDIKEHNPTLYQMVVKTHNDLKAANPTLHAELVDRCSGKCNPRLNKYFSQTRIVKSDGTLFSTASKIILSLQ